MNQMPQNDAAFEASYRTGYLISAYLQQKLTLAEQEELDDWIEAAPENLALFEELIDEKNTKQSLKWFKQLDTERAKRRLHQKLALPPRQLYRRTGRNVLPRWIPYAVAACMLLLAGAGAWYYTARPAGSPLAQQPGTAIQPGSNKATLTLADGRLVVLDSAPSGNLAVEHMVTIRKEDSVLTYLPAPSTTFPSFVYNTLTVPKGGQYRLRLADGTQVWLNSASSLHFPTSFTGGDRRVTLQGEGYFEVAKNAALPFHVLTSGADIAVLGTHFNVHAYGDETALETTLLEGSVRVSKAGQAVVLRPGEQATMSNAGSLGIQINRDADVEKVTAWKEGRFVFRDDSLPTIMNELERWYNIRIENASRSSYHFTATFERSVPLTKILTYLEGTGQVRFQVNGRTITVRPPQ